MRYAVLMLMAMAMAMSTGLAAQTVQSQRVWLGGSAQVRPSSESRWRIVVDTMLRSSDDVQGVEAWHVRPALARDLTPQSSVWVGYALFAARPASGPTTYERRVWQQYLWSRPTGGGTLTTRTRLEQRWMDGNDRLSLRFRQQLRFGKPLRVGSRVSALIWDEFTLHLNTTHRTQRGFDQNRLFVGMSVAAGERARVEVGYQNQFVYSRTSVSRLSHILSAVVGLTF